MFVTTHQGQVPAQVERKSHMGGKRWLHLCPIFFLSEARQGSIFRAASPFHP